MYAEEVIVGVISSAQPIKTMKIFQRNKPSNVRRIRNLYKGSQYSGLSYWEAADVRYQRGPRPGNEDLFAPRVPPMSPNIPVTVPNFLCEFRFKACA